MQTNPVDVLGNGKHRRNAWRQWYVRQQYRIFYQELEFKVIFQNMIEYIISYIYYILLDGVSTTDHHSVAHAPKYIGLACVVFVALAMVLSLYYMLVKRKSEGPSSLRMRGSLGNLHSGPNIPFDDERRFRDSTLAAGLTGLAANMQEGTSSIGSLTGSLGHRHRSPGTAYTITINSQSATNLDEAILPLTEDKTRF